MRLDPSPSLVSRVPAYDDENRSFDHAFAVRFAVLALGTGLWIGPLALAADDAGPADVMQVDREFASFAQDTDVRAAFEQYLADDAVLLRPLPEQARAWLETHEPANGMLDWTPAGALVACDGSFAVTIGNWRYTPPQTRGVETGQYLTAWRRDARTGWRIVLDAAASIDTVAAVAERLRGATRTRCPSAAPQLAKLDAAEARLNGVVSLQDADGRQSSGLVGTRLGRFTGGDHADVAVTYGKVVLPGSTGSNGDPDVRGVYVRVWQRREGDWNVIIDSVSPVAP